MLVALYVCVFVRAAECTASFHELELWEFTMLSRHVEYWSINIAARTHEDRACVRVHVCVCIVYSVHAHAHMRN